MKKLNYITVLGLAAGLTFAGSAMAQSGGILNGDGGAWQLDNSSQSAFKALQDASLTVAWVENSSGNTITFGYYRYKGGDWDDFRFDLDDTANTFTLGTVSSSGERISAADAGYDADAWTKNFDKDDLVGIWVKEGDGDDAKYYYSPGKHNQGQTSATIDDPKDGEADAWFGTPSHSKAPIQLHFSGSGEITAASTGGPLPGVWATIALAGAASAYLKRRRKENK